MNPTTPPKSAQTEHIYEHLRFVDTPGPAPMDAFPFNRCPTCQGLGRMAETICPDCKGAGGGLSHSAEIALKVVSHIQQQLQLESGPQSIVDVVSILVGDTSPEQEARIKAYRREHISCYLAGLVLATRAIISLYIHKDSEHLALEGMHRELDGRWNHTEAP